MRQCIICAVFIVAGQCVRLKVVKKGYTLAKAMGAKTILMHALYEPVYYSSLEYSPIVGFNDYANMGALQVDTIEGLKEAAQSFLNKTKHHLADESIQTILKEGDTADTIRYYHSKLYPAYSGIFYAIVSSDL